MLYRFRGLLSFIFVATLCGTTLVRGQVQQVGIATETLNYFYSEQQNTQWCWAAGIQMILNYWGVYITQDDIVRRTYGRDRYGRLPNYAAPYQAITANLNSSNIDRNGLRYRVVAEMRFGSPDPARLIAELENGYPVLVGYRTGRFRGHAVVLTAASFLGSVYDPILNTITVRDPWPSYDNLRNRGRQVYWADALNEIEVYWYIRVREW